jgi:hypothetical protein
MMRRDFQVQVGVADRLPGRPYHLEAVDGSDA